MAYAAGELSDLDFLHSYIAEYLDGELAPELRTRFEKVLQSLGQAEVPERFQAKRGRLQLALSSYYLKDAELSKLRALVQDPTVQATQEHMRIDQLSRKAFLNTLMRRIVLLVLALGTVGYLTWRFMPRNEVAFKPLEYLGYEALAIEDDPDSRLDLPSKDLREIRQYLATYPGLTFKPHVFKNVAANWQPDGASVIDYEVAKVALVQYSHEKLTEKVFHFSYPGSLSDLPKSDVGNMRGLVYQTYSSDELNLVAWQYTPGVVSLLVGRRSAPELAEMALQGEAK